MQNLEYAVFLVEDNDNFVRLTGWMKDELLATTIANDDENFLPDVYGERTVFSRKVANDEKQTSDLPPTQAF